MSGVTHSGSIKYHIDSSVQLQVVVSNVKSLPWLDMFSETERALISTVVAELGSNILKYAGKGVVTLTPVSARGRSGVEVVAEDRGPGIADIELAMTDRFSTSGTLGLGLPGVKRMMSSVEINTRLGQGTQVVARKFAEGALRRPPRPDEQAAAAASLSSLKLDFASQVRPHPHETFSGDFALAELSGDTLFFGIIDISGHGYQAHLLGRRLVEAIKQATDRDPQRLLETLNAEAVGTRGAAVGLALLDRVERRLSFAGVGNVHIRCFGARTWRCVSRDGVLGERMAGVLPQTQALKPGDVIVDVSDGVSERTITAELEANLWLPAQSIATRVIRRAGRATDDASCVVVKCLP